MPRSFLVNLQPQSPQLRAAGDAEKVGAARFTCPAQGSTPAGQESASAPAPREPGPLSQVGGGTTGLKVGRCPAGALCTSGTSASRQAEWVRILCPLRLSFQAPSHSEALSYGLACSSSKGTPGPSSLDRIFETAPQILGER